MERVKSELQQANTFVAETFQQLEEKRAQYRILKQQSDARERQLLEKIESLRGKPAEPEKPA
jgi:hypothetical protein